MLLFGGESRWRADVWSEHKHDKAFFQNGFYPLEASIDPFWAIRAGLEMSATDAGLEDYLDPKSDRKIRVKRGLTGAIAPADSLYTTIFEQKVAGSDLLGLSCYLPDWRIPDHETEQEHRAKLDELLTDLMSSP
ncbi:hypothetical protein [Cupriavidus sp. amp6]|uniref:hypothetical protein n=1 Tax=Cupriavidus sp. amp6 TaxID=388051 RepID=UPI0004128EFE|nr:hypothetical protein [Cupriavidus sp. amp6]